MKFAGRTRVEKYRVDPQSAIGRDTFKTSSPTHQEITKGIKAAIWRAKRLMAQLRLKRSVGGDSDEVTRDAPAAVAQPQAARHWILDSGSCFDMVGGSTLSKKNASCIRDTGKFATRQTANGVVRENRRIELPAGNINRNVDAVVLDGCPSFLSLGRRWFMEAY